MLYDVIMYKLTQLCLVVMSGAIYLYNQIDGTIVSRAFDQLFSIGLLVVLVIMLYREWKGSKQYNEERDKRLEELVKNNTDALNSFREEIKMIHRRIDENRRKIDEK